MKILNIFVVLMVGLSCTTIGSCKQVPPRHADPQVQGCSQAESAMIALEHGDSTAIGAAMELMSCYDGAYAERVDVALGNMIINYPKKVFAAMHENQFGEVMVNGVVNTQPWDLVDKPCRFSSLLERREKVIGKVAGYPKETKLAMKGLAGFIPIVSAHCKAATNDKKQ